MSGGLPEKFGERIAELDTFPGAEARQGCAMLEKEIAEAIRAASGRDRIVLDSLRRKLAVRNFPLAEYPPTRNSRHSLPPVAPCRLKSASARSCCRQAVAARAKLRCGAAGRHSGAAESGGAASHWGAAAGSGQPVVGRHGDDVLDGPPAARAPQDLAPPQALAFAAEERELAFRGAEVEARGAQLAEMQRDLEGLHECMRDVGTLVHQQGTELGAVEHGGFGHAQSATFGAAREAAKAGKARAGRRAVEGGAVTAAIGAAIGIVGGPVGMGLGAAAGAGLGSLVGNRIGRSERTRIDREFAALQER